MAINSNDLQVNVDNLIERLLQVRKATASKNLVQMSVEEMNFLCDTSKDIFLKEPTLLELQAPINICGDIHGQYIDLLRHLDQNGFPPQSNYLFLGNYVNRGRQSLETICLLLAYKIKYPNNIFLLRGNHECVAMVRLYGFYDECKRRYNIKLWKAFTACFDCLPIVAIINEKIFCCHGGLSPDLHSLEQIRGIKRPIDIPDHGLLCDLLWSSPDRDVESWMEYSENISYLFGCTVVKQFLDKFHMDLICRARQIVEDGYEFFANRQLVTISSAPDHLGEFDNAAATMRVDQNLVCSFMILPRKRTKTEKKEDRNLKLNNSTQAMNMIRTDIDQKHVKWADLDNSISSQDSESYTLDKEI